jgi:predicted AlkP superfamily pyrophosphatase or phosphodiesterase
MKMKTIFLASLVSVSFLSGQNKKLLFIGIDGCRPDALSQAQTPNMDALINNGLFINDALCSINGQPTVSGPGWSTMITGVWYDKHGVSDNSFSGSNYDEYPPFNVLM